MPTLLCVDDEPQVLASLALLLKRRFTVLTASSGAMGIQHMREHPEIDVVISDMRMPGMDGAKFLHAARSISPDTPRILLTGQADLESAIAAVNDGQIYRFLVKPCPQITMIAAVESALNFRRLIQAERVLLQETLTGAIQALVSVLALKYPSAFGAAERVKRLVGEIAATMAPELRWALEVAALLRPLGTIALPDEVADRVRVGVALTPAEQSMLDRSLSLTETLVSHIPRLESVRALLALLNETPIPHGCQPAEDQLPLYGRAAAILRATVDFDRLMSEGLSAQAALNSMQARKSAYNFNVLEALEQARSHEVDIGLVQEVSPYSLRAGMVIARDVVQNNGVLLVARGYEVTEGLVERIRNLQSGVLATPIYVVAGSRGKAASASDPPAEVS